MTGRRSVARGMRELAAAGDPMWAEHVANTAFEARVSADAHWLAQQRAAFAAALR